MTVSVCLLKPRKPIDVQAERKLRRAALQASCELNSSIFIKNCAEVARAFNLPWLTPGSLLENFSLGRFGKLLVDQDFSTKSAVFFVEVNDAFLDAMPFTTWKPTFLHKFPTQKNGGRPKKGFHRLSIIELLGAGLAAYHCDEPSGPWFDLYEHLEGTFVALSKEGHNLMTPEGPLQESGYHGHNFLATMEEINITAKERNRDALFRLWYWRKPPQWWGKDWHANFLKQKGMMN